MLYIAPERQLISWDSIIAEETEYIEVGCVNCDMVLGGDEILKSDIASMGYQEAVAKFIGFHLCSMCKPAFKLVVTVEATPITAPDWAKDIIARRKAPQYVQSILPQEDRITPRGTEGTVDDRGWIQPPTLQGCQTRAEYIARTNEQDTRYNWTPQG